MKCPHCGNPETQVKDSRSIEDDTAIRRRRSCPECGQRFTTFERIQIRELFVIKSSGRRIPFEREKLERSINIALRKRPVAPEKIDTLVSSIVHKLEASGESDIASKLIGEMVMDGLKAIDPIAYVRFASVYRDFREARDFESVVAELNTAQNS